MFCLKDKAHGASLACEAAWLGHNTEGTHNMATKSSPWSGCELHTVCMQESDSLTPREGTGRESLKMPPTSSRSSSDSSSRECNCVLAGNLGAELRIH